MMKKVFIIAAFAGLMSCGQDDCCEKPIVIKGEQFDFTQDEGVSDSLVYGEWEPIDSLTTVTELLKHLETLPSNEEIPN